MSKIEKWANEYWERKRFRMLGEAMKSFSEHGKKVVEAFKWTKK